MRMIRNLLNLIITELVRMPNQGGWIAAAGAAASLVGGASGKKGKKKAAKQAEQQQMTQARLADPMFAERPYYIQRLRQLMTDPNAVMSSPSYRARLRAGQQSVEASGASRGLLGSGAMAQELQAKGQELASQEYESEYGRLATLAGANSANLGAASQSITQQQQREAELATRGRQSNQDIAAGIGGLASAAGQYFGGGSTWGGPSSDPSKAFRWS